MFDLGLTLENPFQAEWLFKPRLIQATVRLNSQLLSQETLIAFRTNTVRDARGSGVVIETDRPTTGRTMVEKAVRSPFTEAAPD
jgi:hypothetical protein